MENTILKISENQEESKNLGDIISKLNLFLKKNGLDKDGVDFLEGSNSNKEKEIEDKLEKLRTTQEQIECLGDFLNNLQKREKNKINSEFNKEKLDYNSILSQYGIKNENGKIDLGKKFKIEEIFTLDDKNNKIIYSEYNKRDKNDNLLIKELEKYNKKNKKELFFQDAINSNSDKEKLNNIKKNIHINTGKINKEIKIYQENSTENKSSLEYIENENEWNKSMSNDYNIKNRRLKNEKTKLESNKYIIKNNIGEINNLLNNKNISKEDLKKLKEQKEKLKKDLEKISKEILELNILIRSNKESIIELDIEKKELLNDFKELLEKQEKDSIEFSKKISEIQIQININYDDLKKYNKFNKQKTETDKLVKEKIKDMLLEAEEIKNNFKENDNIKNKYNTFIEEIKKANKDGEITDGKWYIFGDGEKELSEISNKFEELKNAKEKSRDSNEYILTHNEKIKSCKDKQIIEAIKKYGRLKTIDSKELKRMIQSLENFEKIRDFYERKFGLDYEGYEDAKNKFLSFIDSEPYLFVESNFNSFNRFDKKINENYLGKYNKTTINIFIKNAEEEGNEAKNRNIALANKDIFDGTKDRMIEKIGNIQDKLNLLNNFLNKQHYFNKKYDDKRKYLENLINEYGKENPENIYDKLTKLKYGNITLKQINEINLISDQLDYITKNLDKNIDKLDKIKTLKKQKFELKRQLNNYIKNLEIVNYTSLNFKSIKIYLDKHLKTINNIENEQDLNETKKILSGTYELINLYKKLENTNDNKYDSIKKNILNLIEKKVNIDEDRIKSLNNEAINAGLDSEQLYESIGRLEGQLKTKFSFDINSIGEEYLNLSKLKKYNPLIYLKVLGEINKFKTSEDIEKALSLWNTIIGKEKDLLSLNFGDLVNKSLNSEIKIEDKDFEFFKDENDVLNYLNIETGFELNKNHKLSRANERKALLILSMIKNNENKKQAKKLINFALNNNCLGDIRIINKLRILAGSNEETKNTETKNQIGIELTFRKKDSSELNLFVGEGDDTNLLANNKDKHELLGIVTLSDFKNDFIKALNSNKEGLMSFIQANPRASMSFFAYLMKNPNTLNLNQKFKIFNTYENISTKLAENNIYIQKASGENSLMIELQQKFGETGRGKFLRELKTKLEGIVKGKSGSFDEIKTVIEDENSKETLIKLINNLNFNEQQKKILLDAIEKGILTVEDKDILEKTKEKQEAIDESINNILSKNIKDKVNEEEINSIKKEISSILENKEKNLSDEKNIKNNLIKVKELLEEKITDKEEIKNILIEITNLASIKKIGLDITFLKVADKLAKYGDKTQKLGNAVKDTVQNKTQAEKTKAVTEKINTENSNTNLTEKITKAVINSKEEFDKIDEKNKNLEEKVFTGKAKNTLETSGAKNNIDLVATISKSKLLTKEEKESFNKKVHSDKLIKNAIKIAKENPEQSEDLRKTLKEYKKELSKKTDLSSSEQKTLKRLNSYNLDKPNMPAVVLGKEKEEINKAMDGKDSANINIGGKDYLATKNQNGDLALLDKSNNELLTITNDGTTETIKLTSKEKEKLKNNPKGISHLADFRRMMTELNIADELWDMRETIFTQISNLEPSFKIDEKEYLSESNLILFLNTILKVTGKATLKTSSSNMIKTHFKKENFSNGGLSEKRDTNIYGDSEIGAIFIKEYKPRGNVTGFNITKFRNASIYGLEKAKNMQ